MRYLFPDVLFMRRRDFIDESFRLFPGKPAVSELREYFHVEFISFIAYITDTFRSERGAA